MSIPENPDPGGEVVHIRPVETRRDWNCFHAMPARIQGADPHYIEPLALQARQLWRRSNPYFAHAEACAWLAVRGTVPVGRISAQIDALQEHQGRAGLGQFGQLEAVDDAAVFEALTDRAGEWLRSRGCTRMQGPFDLSINHQCGLLCEGFDTPPMLMMGHAPQYYAGRLEGAGLRPVAELLAYIGPPDFPVPPVMARLEERFGRRIRLEAIGRARLGNHAELLRGLFNDAWSNNWGFVPMTRAEFAHAVGEMKALIRPGYVQLAFVDERPAGFLVTLPNLNELIADLDGRLFPIGAPKLLWRLHRRAFRGARVLLMGVRPEFQGGMIGAALSYRMMAATSAALVRDGVRRVEQSWILEQNRPMRRLLESLGMEVYKRYRIFERDL